MKGLKTRLVLLLAVSSLCALVATPGATSAQIGPDIPHTPVIWDISGNGYDVCSEKVLFDFDGNGTPESITWTAAGSDDGLLALDLDHDGWIENGSELFGNFTPQPNPPPGIPRNGFNALAVYDTAQPYGTLNSLDPIWTSLRLWVDYNHDAVSQGYELIPLDQLNVVAISMAYVARDGNQQDCDGYVGFSTAIYVGGFRPRYPKMHDVFLHSTAN